VLFKENERKGTGDGRRRAEVGSQETEARSQDTEVGSSKAAVWDLNETVVFR
jgi:hypothetical protein